MLEEPGLPWLTLVAPEKSASLGRTVFTRRNFLGWPPALPPALAFYAGEIARHELEIVYRTITLPDYLTRSPA
jgi:hypothetical protein